MTSFQPIPADQPGSKTSDAGFLTLDAGPDTSRADYSGDTPADLNDSSHDFDNADESVPGSDRSDARDNVVDRQLGVISRLPG